jgi:hypothetical protein
MDKHELTKKLLQEAAEYNLNLTYEEAVRNWWWPVSRLSPGHMRLTNGGSIALSRIVTPYDFPFNFLNTPKQLKMLSKMPVPYYVDYSGKIRIFSKDLAVMITMYENFDRYLELIQSD